MPAGVRLEPEEVWNYSSRTLTQSQFPFWKSVIISHSATVSVPAGSFLGTAVHPNPNETWYVCISMTLYTNAHACAVYLGRNYSGSVTYHIIDSTDSASGKNSVWASCHDCLNYDTYAYLQWWNGDGSNSHDGAYHYGGFKLGTKIYDAEEINIRRIETVRKTKKKIDSLFEGLENNVYDIYEPMRDDYIQIIYFYKDKIVRRDKQTKHPIERVSSYIETDVLKRNLERIVNGELDLERTGYKEWLDKIKKEKGIDLLKRL